MGKISQQLPVWVMIVLCCLGDIVAGTSIDLTKSCGGISASSCLLSSITSTYDDPLLVSNSSAPNVRELVIRNSAVGGIPTAIFERTPNLQKFIMQKCGLNRLGSSDFERVGQLKVLALQQNRLFMVPEQAFQPLQQTLEELYLGYNTIHIMHRRALAGLIQLKYLDAPHNGIRSVQGGMFDDLINLEHIDLSHNEIEVIDLSTFAKNTKLSSIMLGDNKFSVFEPNCLRHLSHLRLLDLSNTALEELQLQSVDVLQVPDSGLKRCTITGGVIKLIAPDNALQSVQVGDKLMVQEVQLHGNLLESLVSFEGMLNLRRLDVSHNHLTSLGASLPNLDYLNLATNQVKNVSSADFILMTKLTSLDLAYNQLSSLDVRVFEPLKSLQQLYVEGNHLLGIDYENMKGTHEFLHELGLEHNDWNLSYLKKMTTVLQEQGVYVAQRFGAYSSEPEIATEVIPIRKSPEEHEVERLVGVTGIHPYWTLRDILALITLIVVLFILLLQFYRILQEEQCCRRGRNFDFDTREPLVQDNSLV